jgi:DNA-binding SARP family transcriptional activator
LYFRVLGDVAAVVDGEARPVTAARQRAALAILLLSANRTVAATALIDGIYGASLPKHPDTALQIVVCRLRDALGEAAQRLLSLPGGYRFDVESDELDLAVVQSALARGEQLHRDRDADRAVAVLDDALAHWTSEPLHDLAAFPFFAGAHDRLRDLRMTLVELRNESLLDCGRHVEVLESIDDALRDEPWRERLRLQQMLALYRSGRHVDALRAYEDYRKRLVEELGVEPSRELSERHYAVLTHAPELAVDTVTLGSPIPLWTSLVLPFVDRQTEQERIFHHLRAAATGRPTMVLIDGEAGIGKTRLVLEVARRAQDDAIIVCVTGNDALRPPIVGMARSVVGAMAALPTEQLAVYLGQDPIAMAAVVPALADRLPDLRPAGGWPEIDDERLSAAVISCVRALSARAPILLLFDDLHRAGTPILLLLGRLLTIPGTDRIVVLASSRSPSAQRSAALAEFADRLERRGDLERLQLTGLDLESVELLLARLGMDEPGAARALHEVTDGHPFFLSEILQSEDWQHALVEPPPSVREFVRRRVVALGNAVEGVLLDASGLRIAFDAPLIAEISGVPERTSETLIDKAADAGILRTVDKGTFTFVHELSRRSLEDRLDDGERAGLHDRIARALEGRDVPATLTAWHRSSAATTEIDLRGDDSSRPDGRIPS